MSSTTPVLLRGLVDDAAVFPPARTPLPEAVRAHAVHRGAWYAGCVGPLLLPASAVADLLELRRPEPDASPPAEALGVVLVSRPGADPATLTAALDAARAEASLTVVGAELAWEPGWRDLGLDDLALALEVPRGAEQGTAVGDVRAGLDEGRPVVAKFRTGPTPTWPWPDEGELAAFLRLAASADAPFKLTGGLHHAVRGTYPVDGAPEEHHGILNVLLATAAAGDDAGDEEVAALLALRDGEALAELVRSWPDATAARVRRAFTSYGCCTVTDPVGELADLGLLDRP